MDRYKPEKLGDVLRLTLEQKGMTQRLLETKAAALWPSVVGENIASLCGKPFVEKGVLSVVVPSASLRQELNMCRSTIARHINESLGHNVIVDIRFR